MTSPFMQRSKPQPGLRKAPLVPVAVPAARPTPEPTPEPAPEPEPTPEPEPAPEPEPTAKPARKSASKSKEAPAMATTTASPLVVIEKGVVTHVDPSVVLLDLDAITPGAPETYLAALSTLRRADETPAREALAKRLVGDLAAAAW